jgi:hypothetical protein
VFVVPSFVVITYCHYRRSIWTVSPIHLISQPISLPSFPTLHRIAGVMAYTTTYLPMPDVLYLPLLLLYALSVRQKKLLRCHSNMILWTADFATSVARRGGMPRIMIPGGECARFDAVVLNAYKECPALDQDDRRHHL